MPMARCLCWGPEPEDTVLKILAKMLGVPERAAEDALKSERLARATLSRRQALGGLAALATGRVFNFPTPSISSIKFYLPITPPSAATGWAVRSVWDTNLFDTMTLYTQFIEIANERSP